MKKLLLSAIVLQTLCGWAQNIEHQQQLFDDDWQFTRNGKTVGVNLPHDWDIFDSPDPETGATGTGGGWFHGGKGEYRKTFRTPGGDVVKLLFEGVYQRAEVYVNGQRPDSTAMVILLSPLTLPHTSTETSDRMKSWYV